MSFEVDSNLLSAPGLQVMVSQNGKISRFMAAGLEPAELFAVSMEFASHGSHEHQKL